MKFFSANREQYEKYSLVQLAELETQLNEQILECIHNNLNLSGKVLEIDFAL